MEISNSYSDNENDNQVKKRNLKNTVRILEGKIYSAVVIPMQVLDIIKHPKLAMYGIKAKKSGINGKNGLDDCMQDDMVRSSLEQEAIKVVKEAVIKKEKVLDEPEQFK